jgi:hypothetical protein
MYAIANEKSLRLVYGTFNLAIFTDFVTFYKAVNFDGFVKSNVASGRQGLPCLYNAQSLKISRILVGARRCRPQCL